MKKGILILFMLLFSYTIFSIQTAQDYIADKETAIKIAEAVWLPIYGGKIYKMKPFLATLQGDTVWHVYGTLPASSIQVNSYDDTVITVSVGGVPHIFINKSDGKILNVYHTK